jgi:hypothetical protein
MLAQEENGQRPLRLSDGASDAGLASAFLGLIFAAPHQLIDLH